MLWPVLLPCRASFEFGSLFLAASLCSHFLFFKRSFSLAVVHKIAVFARDLVHDVSFHLGIRQSVFRARKDLIYGSDGFIGHFDALPSQYSTDLLRDALDVGYGNTWGCVAKERKLNRISNRIENQIRNNFYFLINQNVSKPQIILLPFCFKTEKKGKKAKNKKKR